MPTPNSERAAAWKALNPQQREQALSRMSPDQKTSLASDLGYQGGAETATAGDWRDPLTGIRPHNLKSLLPGKNGQYDAGAYAREAGTALGNIGAGGLGVILHPVDTVTGIAKSVAHPIETLKTMGKQFGEAPLETAESMIGQAGATAGLGKVAEGTLKSIPKIGGGVTRAITKTSPREMAGPVKAVGEANEAAVAKAAEQNKTAAQEHLEKTQEALHKTKGAELEHAQKTAQAKEEASTQEKINLKKHFEERDKAVSDRKAAEEKLTAEKLKQGKIGPTQAKLENAWSNLRAGVETARAKALKIGNEKYAAVNPKLNPLRADSEVMQGAIVDAAETLKGTHTAEVPEGFGTEGEGGVKGGARIVNKISDKFGKGDQFTYEDLQGYYSELGSEISKGTLPGDIYHAYDKLHETIGKEMENIAKREDAAAVANGEPNPNYAAKLKDSRDYWRRMKQTFGKQLSQTDAATKALRSSAPDIAEAQDQANRVRLMGSFDPDIPKLFSHIENIKKGTESLPKPSSPRELEQGVKAPTLPPRKPILPKIEPKPVAPPERAALPERPAEIKPDLKTIGPEDVRGAKQEGLAKRAEAIRHKGEGFANTIIILDAIRNALSGDIGGIGKDVAARAIFGAGKHAIAGLLERPAVVRFLTNPTAADIAAIPPEMRGDFSAIAAEAAKKGIKVDPRLYAAAGAAQPRKRVAAALTP